MIPIYLDSSTNFSATVLLQLYTALYTNNQFWIYCHLPLACLCTTHFGTCSGLFYFAVVCTFAIASSPFTLPSQVFSILHCNTVFTVIRFLIPFHLYVLYLALISSHLPFIFTYSNHSILITAIYYC